MPFSSRPRSPKMFKKMHYLENLTWSGNSHWESSNLNDPGGATVISTNMICGRAGNFFGVQRICWLNFSNFGRKLLCDKLSQAKFSPAVGTLYFSLPYCHRLDNRKFGTRSLFWAKYARLSTSIARIQLTQYSEQPPHSFEVWLPFTFQLLLAAWNPGPKPAYDTRGAKSFMRVTQIFCTMSKTFFQGGRKILQWAPPLWAPGSCFLLWRHTWYIWHASYYLYYDCESHNIACATEYNAICNNLYCTMCSSKHWS